MFSAFTPLNTPCQKTSHYLQTKPNSTPQKMKLLRDLVAPAVVSDLVSRLISFLVSQYVKRTCREEGTTQRLQLLTLKIHAVVDEAQQRDLANNRRLLLWVRKLMECMYLAYYMLDMTTHDHVGVDDGRSALVMTSSSCFFCIARPTKRRCLANGGGDSSRSGIDDQLSAVLRRLEVASADLKDFVVLLACCPRIPRQSAVPCFRANDKVMFGRLVEREQVISFLLQPRSNLGILPVTGDPEAGKGTIVKHVCTDERVRNHFAVILYSYGSLLVSENRGGGQDQDVLRTLRMGGHVLHESSSSASGHERHLIVIKSTSQVVIIKEVWVALCESLRCRAPGGSKVVLISESDDIADLGTTMPMHVKPLPREEFWYFFMSLAFGSGPDEHPTAELALLGRQIAAALHGSFFGAKVLGGILRTNFNARFWRGVLDVVQSFHETMEADGDHFSKLRVANIALKTLPRSLRLKTAFRTRTDALEELPRITIQDLLHYSASGVPPREEMRIVLWESAWPPNYRYTVVCEKVKEHQPSGVTELKKKRTRQQ